ncbi:hypothetical protein RRG08_015439 [Elysia crispata]|uniref:Uncharacterized protein n=1 Tax=Elysia crispata TaxID=231223 RepID=A0AAE1CYQ9_9GAST|nr:hypothetical protein RRG08_015439 [Elysia crispata]
MPALWDGGVLPVRASQVTAQVPFGRDGRTGPAQTNRHTDRTITRRLFLHVDFSRLQLLFGQEKGTQYFDDPLFGSNVQPSTSMPRFYGAGCTP